jgi:hypothetical protein
MGIKFQCPNGHKLNVKSFLSGKRAICPKCGARVLVPESPDASGSSVELAIATEPTQVAQTIRAGVTASQPAPAAPAAFASRAPETGVDAIGEAPDALWYVRPASGGQFGPASGEIMRSWLDDGRVGGTSLVWRAGWPEWRAAANVFPQLGSAPVAGMSPIQPPPPQAVSDTTGVTSGPPSIGGSLPQAHMVQSVAVATPAPGLSTAVPPLAQSVRRRRRANDVRLYASAVFVVISIILLIALVVVLKGQNEPQETPTSNSPPVVEKPAAESGTPAP